MFRRLLKSFSKPTVVVQKSMDTARFLINELSDYEEGGEVDVPEKNIQKQIFEYISEIKEKMHPTERNGKDGLYLGTGGIAYMFYHLSKIPALSHFRTAFLRDAVEYIVPALKVCANEVNHEDVPALLLGNCGVYAVASAIFHAIGNEKQNTECRNLYNEAAKTCKDINFLPAGSDELFVGRAGYVCGALWMARETGVPFKTEDIFDVCRIMIASGRQYAITTKSKSPLMYSYYNVEYIGAGHGICTILQVLLSVPGYLEANPADAKAVRQSVDYVLSLQDSEGNFPPATAESRAQNNDLVHWCHGAGGVVYLMAKAYLTWKDDKYLRSCRLATNLIWERGLLKKGPGLCHGVAGNAYVFLLMYRLTQEPSHLHRAVQFSQFLDSNAFKSQARVPDNPYSLFEGKSGAACFLGDMLCPKFASFPFSDIF